VATRYLSLKKIADGGMAEIFFAHQSGAEGFARSVILKRIRSELSADPQFRDMLIDEAHIAMSLNHNNIVPVMDLGKSRGRYFLVMQLVDGWDLAAILRRGKNAGLPLPLSLGLHVMAEICRGLAYAHARKGPDGQGLGIVHRDVSPHNILVGEQGDVKLTDFGLAKALGKRDHTRTGVIKGKLDFMSPEQASGLTLAPSSDIFAVGTILYLLATGRKPFEAATDLETLLKVQRAEFPPLAEAARGVPPGVAAIVDKAMRSSPADRYQSGEAMMVDIEGVLRRDLGSPGQSELKRWLAELAQQDGAPPTSQLPALPVDEPLGVIGADETVTLELEDSAIESIGTDSRALENRQLPRLPSVSAGVARPTPHRSRRARFARRPRLPRAGLRALLLLVILVVAGYGGIKLMSPDTIAAATESARDLLKEAGLGPPSGPAQMKSTEPPAPARAAPRKPRTGKRAVGEPRRKRR
jgi:serine/threonine protein kinase